MLKSAIAEHTHEHLTIHKINWGSMKDIDKAKGTRERRIKEAIHIEKRPPRINRDKGIEYCAIWRVFLFL